MSEDEKEEGLSDAAKDMRKRAVEEIYGVRAFTGETIPKSREEPPPIVNPDFSAVDSLMEENEKMRERLDAIDERKRLRREQKVLENEKTRLEIENLKKQGENLERENENIERQTEQIIKDGKRQNEETERQNEEKRGKREDHDDFVELLGGQLKLEREVAELEKAELERAITDNLRAYEDAARTRSRILKSKGGIEE